jgi:hypothetical protein
MKTAAILLLLTSLAATAGAQSGGARSTGDSQMTLDAFNARRQRTQRIGMIALASWAGLNIVGGSALYFLDEANQSFHQMNAMWNVVNAGLATGGLIGASRELTGWNLARSIEAQHNLEKVYLVNAGLDLGYIMGGLFLAQLGDEYPARADQFAGWGYSIALQGGFLMVFDAVMFIAHRRNREYRPLLAGGE